MIGFGFVLLFGRVLADGLTCEATNSSRFPILWPSTSSFTSSQPPCVNTDKEFLYRYCHNGKWQPEPFCSQIQPKTIPQCPEHFTETINFCYMLTPKSKFPPKCPFPNLLPFYYYIDIVSTNGTPIWMPIQRDLTNGLGFLQWIEASPLYKIVANFTYYIVDGIKNKNCLLFYNMSYIVLTSCEEEHSSICAYHKLEQITDQLCGETCRRSNFDNNSKCFCLGGTEQNQDKYTKVEFLEPYQNYVYQSLTSDPCTIGLMKKNKSYVWVNSGQKIGYCYWSPDVKFDNDNTLGAITPNGWILTKNPLPCFLYEKQLTISEPNLHLRFIKESLNLRIINPEGLLQLNSKILIYCFTNAGFMNLIYRYENFIVTQDDNELVYQFYPHLYGPGFYWCEAFKYSNSEIITSEKIFVNQDKKFGDEYVAIIDVQYIKGTDPLNLSYFEFLTQFLDFTLRPDNKTQLLFRSRIMKLIDIDEINSRILINLHFTSILDEKQNQNWLVTTDEEFKMMRDLINETLSQIKIIQIGVVDFLSASYCPQEEINNVHWPRAEINQKVKSEEFCFDSNGLQIKRFCSGDFIDGAKWSKVDDCLMPKHSSVTEELIEILKDIDDVNVTTEIAEISSRFQEFTSLDVYLLATISFESADMLTEETFVQVLDNLYKVDDDLLKEAQKTMRAADLILETVDKIVVNCNSSNFVTVADDSQNLSGVVFINDEIIKLPSDFTLENIVQEYEDLEAAIWLSPDLRSSFISNNQLIFKLFHNTAFFLDSSQNTINHVYGVVLPRLDFLRNPIYFLYKSLRSREDNCAYWSYDLDSAEGRGYWKIVSKSLNFSSFVLCEFDNTKASDFTIILPNSQSNESVTNDLENLLQSEETPEEIINELADLSDRYEEFSSDDLHLVAEILKRISNTSDLDLTALTHIISNLHEIDRLILSSSQMESQATDEILQSVDAIIKSHNYTETVNVTNTNFMIFMTKIQETNFSGILLFDAEKIQTKNLTGDVNIGEFLHYDGLNSAMVLPSALKNQIDDGIVAITIFATDGLFNEKILTSKIISKIFGVILPVSDQLTEPLSLIYKIPAKNYQQHCSFWSFDTLKNATGFWKKDSNSEDLLTFSECNFWHTTHFALLLLDSDKYDYEILNFITDINCAFSLFGLIGIVLTAIFFKRWRTNSGNQILLNFVFASILQILVFYSSTAIKKNVQNYLVCTIIGIILHYSVVSQFCWMLVIAILQFKRFVEVLKGPPKHVLLKGCLCGWILPLLPVSCAYFFDPDTYVEGVSGLCYPSGNGLYLGVWLPIALIVVINIVIYIYIIYSVVHKRTECNDVGNGEVMFQWRLAVLLFFMLGLTWCFGFLAELEFGVIFVYAFCITATVQGFVMFLFFILFNSNTRYLYSHSVRNCLRKDY